MARGRKPKPKIPQEIQQIVDLVQPEVEMIPVDPVIPTPDFTWDVKREDNIPFFDAHLSYEITGYRPIDDKNGLDFDPEWFIQARRTKEATGKYCAFMPFTKPWNEHWQEEYTRCRDGMTVNGYTITGDNYFFLNYYILPILTGTEKAGAGRNEDFPKFHVKQYEYFHYIELCKRLRLNAVGLKARGVGFSEIGAALAINTYSVRPKSRTVITANTSDYVTRTINKCWKQLNYLDSETEKGFQKLRQKINRNDYKRASNVNTEGIESGFMSEVEAIVADTPNKIRGDRVDILIYEESGSWPNWVTAFLQGDALVGVQGSRFGIKLAWGTGGDSGPNLAGLADAYYNPETVDALPYRHNYTPDGETAITSYFIPAYSIIDDPKVGATDHRGWTDPVKGREHYETERLKKANNPKAYIVYCAEYCFNAEEALSLEGDNIFNKILIADQIARIRLLKQGPEIEVGSLEYIFRNNEHTDDSKTGIKFVRNPNGKVKIMEHPIRDKDGNVPRNLYVAGIDGIDMGQEDTSDNTRNPSQFCIVVKKRVFGVDEPVYVCTYKDRPQTLREAHLTCLKILEYYNCQAVLESTRISLLQFFREKKKENRYLMRRPRATQSDIQGGRSKQFGAPATETVIKHQLELIAQYIEDHCQEIWFLEMLDELQRYSYQNKKSFDMIAAMGMAELGDEELMGIRPQKTEEATMQLRPFGFWVDERGIRRRGAIPKEYQQQKPGHVPDKNPLLNDYQGARTSNKRFDV